MSEVSSEYIPLWRRGVVAAGVDTHSYSSGHMLMRVTGLEEKWKEGGRGSKSTIKNLILGSKITWWV